jgi:hypothetical protein
LLVHTHVHRQCVSWKLPCQCTHNAGMCESYSPAIARTTECVRGHALPIHTCIISATEGALPCHCATRSVCAGVFYPAKCEGATACQCTHTTSSCGHTSVSFQAQHRCARGPLPCNCTDRGDECVHGRTAPLVHPYRHGHATLTRTLARTGVRHTHLGCALGSTALQMRPFRVCTRANCPGCGALPLRTHHQCANPRPRFPNGAHSAGVPAHTPPCQRVFVYDDTPPWGVCTYPRGVVQVLTRGPEDSHRRSGALFTSLGMYLLTQILG